MLNFWVKNLRKTYIYVFYVFIILSSFFKCFGIPETYLYEKLRILFTK